jgi:hypothetical protein
MNQVQHSAAPYKFVDDCFYVVLLSFWGGCVQDFGQQFTIFRGKTLLLNGAPRGQN